MKTAILILSLLVICGCSKIGMYRELLDGKSESDSESNSKAIKYYDCCQPDLTLGTQIICLELKNDSDHIIEGQYQILIGTCFN